MEDPGGEKSSLSQSHHRDLASSANHEHPDEFELELAVKRHQNGAADTDHVPENGLHDRNKLEALNRREFFNKLLKNVEDDHLHFLRRQKERMERVDVKLPAIEVRYDNLYVEVESRITNGNHLPTLWNSTKGVFSGLVKLLGLLKTERAPINILDDVSGIIKPCRLTLLLGPPGCGKSTLLRALTGKLDKSLKVTGDISYNGYQLHEFVPEKTASYISQYDLHIPDMTVRETLDFSARCQGVGRRPEILEEVSVRESIAGIIPDADIDLYMKAIAVESSERSLLRDYILKVHPA